MDGLFRGLDSADLSLDNCQMVFQKVWIIQDWINGFSQDWITISGSYKRGSGISKNLTVTLYQIDNTKERSKTGWQGSACY